MTRIFNKFWQLLKRPAVSMSLGLVVVLSFIAGVVFWGGFNKALDATDTEEFCVSCHTMSFPLEELKETAHWKNASGVTASCPDCHVPHGLGPIVARKIEAAREVYAEFTGKIDTKEKYDANREEMAKREWARFAANGSQACKNCHDYKKMDFTKMSKAASSMMIPAAAKDQSCLDCHKGIAHHLPASMQKKASTNVNIEQLVQDTSITPNKDYYSVSFIPMFEDNTLTKNVGELSPATKIKVIAVEGDNVEATITGWRKAKGFKRVIQQDFGQNIRSAVLDKTFARKSPQVVVDEKKEDAETGLPWEDVTITFWMKKGDLIDSIQPLWDKTAQTYNSTCSGCHTQPDPAHFDANTWIGQLNGMLNFVSFDKTTEATVLKYLQLHSSSYEKH